MPDAMDTHKREQLMPQGIIKGSRNQGGDSSVWSVECEVKVEEHLKGCKTCRDPNNQGGSGGGRSWRVQQGKPRSKLREDTVRTQQAHRCVP